MTAVRLFGPPLARDVYPQDVIQSFVDQQDIKSGCLLQLVGEAQVPQLVAVADTSMAAERCLREALNVILDRAMEVRLTPKG